MDNENIDKTEIEGSEPADLAPTTEEPQPVAEEGQAVSEEGQAVAEEGQPVGEEVQPVGEESQPVAEEGQPVAEEGQPVTEEGQPVAEESQLDAEEDQAAEEGQPVAEESQPVAEEGQPVGEEGQPVAEESQPVAEEGQAVSEEGQPVSEESQPTIEESQPVAEEGQPVGEEGQPVAEESQPVAEEGQPVAEESQLDAEEDQAAEEGQAVSEEGQPVAEENQPISEESQAVSEEGQPATEEAQAVPEEGQAVAEEGQPVSEEVQPAIEESQPVIEDQPDTEEGQAVSEEGQPAAEESQAVPEEGQPVTEEEQAVVEESQPVAEEVQPAIEESQPVAEVGQPVAEEGQPVAEEGQAVAEEGQPVGEESQPVAEEGQAVIEESQAVAEEEQAVAEEGQAVAEEVQPATEESQPVAEEGQAVIEESQAVAEEEQAVAEEGQAVAEEVQPPIEESQAVSEEGQPVAEVGQPVAEEGQPVAEESQPVVAENETGDSHKAVKETISEKIGGPRKQRRLSVAQALSHTISKSRGLIILNIVVIAALISYILLKPSPSRTTAQTKKQTIVKQVQSKDISSEPQALREESSQKEEDAVVVAQGISWHRAEQLYNGRQYREAYEIFRQLSDNLNTNRPGDEYVRDFMHLKMSLCLQQTGEQSDSNEHLTAALHSSSPAVRALANYNLIFTENRKKEYLSVRMRAYRTLSLLKTVKDAMPESFEADCYFTIGECLTKHVLSLCNEDGPLPGKFWSDTLTIETVREMEQKQLLSLLQRGIAELNDAVLSPQVKRHRHLSIGLRWSAVCREAPLEELLTKFASSAKLNVQWQANTDQERLKPTILYLPTSSEQAISEVAAGSQGLIAQLDADSIRIYNPNIYDNLDEYKDLLVREAISVWRRFLLRHRGDYRTPNAHFALGLLQEHAGEQLAALGEYKLLSSHYAHNPLAPFALLNASKLKTNMLDYTGASKDLTELIIQYPDCKVSDHASLYLAEATMQAGLYDQAIKMFRKVYNLDLNADSQRQATFGLGKCFFETQNFEEAKKWLSEAIKLIGNPVDERLCPAYFMLGKTEIELGNYEQASTALRKALEGLESKEEYIRIMLCLVNTERGQQNFVGALNILENVPVSQLSQEYACEVLIAKSHIFREIGITDTAISLLRRKIEFIADSEFRARLSFELAKCYRQTGDLRIARKEVSDAIADLRPGAIAQQAKLFLADVSIQLGEYEDAKQVCLQFLNQGGYDEQNRNEALELLGRAYTKLDKLDKAALAYAGIYDQTKVDAK